MTVYRVFCHGTGHDSIQCVLTQGTENDSIQSVLTVRELGMTVYSVF